MAKYRLPEELEQVSQQQAHTTKGVIENELGALDAVISEAEQKRRDPYLRGYEEVYRHGFGKTVVIDTELKGKLIYRVSQATGDYANTKLGVSSPNTPIGNLCRGARLGVVHESDEWGEYSIIEIRNFARYSGKEAADHIRNFRVMESESFSLSGKAAPFQVTVANLRAALGRWFAKEDKPQIEPALQPMGLPTVEWVAPMAPASVDFDFDFDFDIDEPVLLADAEAEQGNHYDIFGRSEQEQDDYYGLSNYFCLNPTEEQLAIMTNTVHAGPMLVEGVAGSGKTCAALGRAKTLCDLARSPDDEQFNSDFLAESSVGFVRTGELVQYLRASCLELDISQLPIEEYAGLVYQQSRARNLFIEQRKPVASSVGEVSELAGEEEEEGEEVMVASAEDGLATATVKPKTKYHNLGMVPDYDFQHETRMPWLRAICAVIGWRIAEDLQQMGSLVLSENVMKDKFLAKAGNAEALLALVNSRLTALYQPLLAQLREQSAVPFALDRVITQIHQAQRQLERELFDKHTKWVNPAAGEWRQVQDAKGAVDLLRKTGAALVVYERVGSQMTISAVMIEVKADLLNLFKQGATILTAESMAPLPESAAETVWQQLQSEELALLCQLTDGQPIPLKWARDFDDLSIQLINKKLFALVGRRIFNIVEANPFCRQITVGQKPTSLEKAFKAQLRRIYRKWQFADLYRDALLQPYADDKHKAASCVASVDHWHAAADRLKDRLLAEHDKDLLLALAHIMTRDLAPEAPVPAHMLESTYYRSVFIDEVQDFTEQQIFLMAEQADPKYHAVTLVGDMHQQLGSGNVQNISSCFPYRPLNSYLLKENKRQEREPQLAATAMLFRAQVQQDCRLAEPEWVEKWITQAKTGSSKHFHDCSFEDLDHYLLGVVNDQPHGRTIAVVCPSHELACQLEARMREPLSIHTSRISHIAEQIELAKKYMVHFSCAEHVKGLEFDTVIYAGMEHIDWNDAHQLNKAYVALSRPRKQLVMFGNSTRLPSHVSTCLLPETHVGIH